jgi:hypothetical protein
MSVVAIVVCIIIVFFCVIVGFFCKWYNLFAHFFKTTVKQNPKIERMIELLNETCSLQMENSQLFDEKMNVEEQIYVLSIRNDTNHSKMLREHNKDIILKKRIQCRMIQIQIDSKVHRLSLIKKEFDKIIL